MAAPNMTVSPLPPPTAAEGDFWWNDTTGHLYIRFDDGTSAQWVVANPFGGPPGPPGPQGEQGEPGTVPAVGHFLRTPAIEPDIPEVPAVNDRKLKVAAYDEFGNPIVSHLTLAELETPPVMAPPERGLAMCADGHVHITPPIVSKRAWRLREDGVTQSGTGGTIDIRLQTLPSPLPTQLTVRVCGRNNVDNRLPPADGTWPVTVAVPPVADPAWNVNDYQYTLTGSVWKPMDYDGGVAFEPDTLIDAAAALNEMSVIVRAHGGGTIQLPPGCLALKSAVWRVPENTTVWGYGTWLFKVDKNDQVPDFSHSLAAGAQGVPPDFTTTHPDVTEYRIFGLAIYDNRGWASRYTTGEHALDIGGSGGNDFRFALRRIFLTDVYWRGSGGYGGSWGDSCTKKEIYITRMDGKWSDGDFWDTKDGEGPAGINSLFYWDTIDGGWSAMGGIGTNYSTIRGEPTPFSATAGGDTVTVFWRRHGMASGTNVIITNLTTNPDNGLTIPVNIPVPITADISNVDKFTIHATGSATATASWGNYDVEIRRTLPTNSIRTYQDLPAGEEYFSIPRDVDQETAPGEIVTLKGGAVVNGVNTEGSFYCIGFANDGGNAGPSIAITSGSYTTETGIVTLALATPVSFGPGRKFTLSALTGSPEEVAFFTGSHVAIVPTGGLQVTFSDTPGLPVINITGGTLKEDLRDHRMLLRCSGDTASSGFFNPGYAGDGGGASVTFDCPHISTGDRFIDMRGQKYFTTNLSWKGEAYGRNVIYQRTSISDDELTGGRYCIIDNANITDLTPAFLAPYPAQGSLLSLAGVGAVVNNCVLRSTSAMIGVNCTASSRDALVSNISVENCEVGLFNAGERNTFSQVKIVNPRVAGVVDWGNAAGGSQDLPINPFFPNAIGSTLVTVHTQTDDGGAPHGRTVGSSFMARFSGFGGALTSGITLVGSNHGGYLATVDSPTTYVFDAGAPIGDFTAEASGPATSTSPFGGTGCRVFYGSVKHETLDCTYDGIEVYSIDPTNETRAFIMGASNLDETGSYGLSRDAIVRNSKQVGCNGRTLDYGQDTKWMGNVGLPNDGEFRDKSVNTWNVIDEVIVDAAAPVRFVDFNIDTETGEFMLECSNLRHYSTANQKFRVQMSSNKCGKMDVDAGQWRICGAAGSSEIALTGNVAPDTPTMGWVTLLHCTDTTRPTTWHARGGLEGAGTFLQTNGFRTRKGPNLSVDSGTYNDATGLVVLTMKTPIIFMVGARIYVNGIKGTGATASLNGKYYTTVATTAGLTVTFVAAAGLGAITITEGVIGPEETIYRPTNGLRVVPGAGTLSGTFRLSRRGGPDVVE